MKASYREARLPGADDISAANGTIQIGRLLVSAQIVPYAQIHFGRKSVNLAMNILGWLLRSVGLQRRNLVPYSNLRGLFGHLSEGVH